MFCFFHVILLFYFTRNLYGFNEQYPKFEKNEQEILLCRQCGADVADSHYIFSKISPGSKKTDKQNLFEKKNVTIQTLVNPFGVKFSVITLEKARCNNIGQQHSADSWFPGYTWRICTCPRCGRHLGWTFNLILKSEDYYTESNHSFHGLILNNILGENWCVPLSAHNDQNAPLVVPYNNGGRCGRGENVTHDRYDLRSREARDNPSKKLWIHL